MSDYECSCPGCGKIGYVELAELYSGDPMDQMCSTCLKSEMERRAVQDQKDREKKQKAYDQWDYPADGEPDYDDPRA